MSYYRFTPHPALCHLVEGIWVQESSEHSPHAKPTTVLPVGRLELLVHYRDPFLRVRGEQMEEMPMAFVLGQRTRAIDVRSSGRTGIVLVAFQPWAATLLLGDAAAEVTDGAVDLDSLGRGLRTTSLGQRVGEAASAEDRVALVQAFLLRSLEHVDLDPLAAAAVEHLHRSRGTIPIHDLARRLVISRRQLNRRFSRAVGLGPKQFGQILRFQKAIGLLRSGVTPIETADRCGYVDQAHLSREVKGFSQRTVGKVRRHRSTPLMHYYNSPKGSHFYSTIYL